MKWQSVYLCWHCILLYFISTIVHGGNSFVILQNPGLELADDFNCFISDNLEEIRERVNDEEFIFNMYDVSKQLD